MEEKQAAAEAERQKQETIKAEWLAFARTSAYAELLDYIARQKDYYNIIATGPMEVFKTVPTNTGEHSTEFEFEPEKYAYLLQRGVGCDIVKIYIEGYTNPEV